MKANKRFYILVFVLLLIIFMETSIIIVQGKKLHIANDNNVTQDINLLDLHYQDSFNTIPVVNTQGKEVVLNYGNNNNILFYLSAACASCGDVLSFVDRLQRVFGEDGLNIMLLWNNLFNEKLNQ